MLSPVYIYRAALKRVIDGDTFVLRVDLGFEVHRDVTVRLRGLLAPESNELGGPEATAKVYAVLSTAKVIIVQTLKTKTGTDVMSFTRYVADVYCDGISLADTLTPVPLGSTAMPTGRTVEATGWCPTGINGG